jgi:serine/threonine protein kinase
MDPPLSSDAKLGRYEIRASLDDGGMGEVYLAVDTRLNRDAAIKFLPANRKGQRSGGHARSQ